MVATSRDAGQVHGVQPSSRVRYRWMDTLRGVAVLLVVGWHVVAVPSLFGVSIPQMIDTFFGATSVVRMPLLFLLSGMLLPGAVRKSLGTYFLGKFRNVAWPYVVWVVITVAAAGTWASLTQFWTWVGGPYHLWFLAVLGACLVVGYLCRWIPPFVLLLGVLILDLLWDPSTNAIARFLQWGAYFFAGATIWPLVKRFGPRGLGWLTCSPLETAGRNSIIWYVAHFAPMLIVCRLLVESVPQWIIYGLCLLVGYGVPYLLQKTRSRMWWLFEGPPRGR